MYKLLNPLSKTYINKTSTIQVINRQFNNLISPRDINLVEKQINLHKKKYLKGLERIKNYDKYVELYGKKEEYLFPSGIIPKFIHNDWCKLNPKTPLWAYPMIYKTAKEQSIKKFSEYVSVEEMCAKDYAKETVKYLEDYFKRNNININDLI